MSPAMRKSDLVPELRQDRNGTFVTRWVKPRGAGRPAGAIPALPSVAAGAERTAARRGGTSKYDQYRARTIRLYLRIPDSRANRDIVPMTDSETIEYMRLGYSINDATEFARWGATPMTAAIVPMGRSEAKEAVTRMHALGHGPEEIARLIRNGLTDEHLTERLTDEEVYEFFRDARSAKDYRRLIGLNYLVKGTCTREDYLVLGLERLASHGREIASSRRDGLQTPTEVLNRMIDRLQAAAHVGADRGIVEQGWYAAGMWMDLRQFEEAYRVHGEAILNAAYPSLFAPSEKNPYRETEACVFTDRFLTLLRDERLNPTLQQYTEAREAEGALRATTAGFVDLLRRDGLTPEQALEALRQGLTREQAREVHLRGQAQALIGGWL